MDLRGYSGYVSFKDLPVDSYFFFLSSTVPHYKIDEGHCIEGGSVYNCPVESDKRVIPLVVEYDNEMPARLKIGFYTIPLTGIVDSEIIQEKILSAKEYVQNRLHCEQLDKSKKGPKLDSTDSGS